MDRPQLSQILVQNAKLTATKLRGKSTVVRDSINYTKKQQEDVLSLKEVDKDQLKMVFQL